MIEPLNIPYEDFWCLKKQKGFSKYHTRAYSQHYQDGIIERIFEVIGVTNKVCVEFGAKNGLDMSTFAGFLNLEIFGVMGPIMVIVVGINAGTHIVAGELNNKTLELVMSTPVGRNNYLFQQILVMITKIFFIS